MECSRSAAGLAAFSEGHRLQSIVLDRKLHFFSVMSSTIPFSLVVSLFILLRTISCLIWFSSVSSVAGQRLIKDVLPTMHCAARAAVVVMLEPISHLETNRGRDGETM